MRLVQQTPTHFTFCLRPWRVWILCGTLAVTGVGVIVALGRVTTLSCDRFGLLAGSCHITSISLLGENSRILSLAEVYGADVDFMYRIILYTSEQSLALTAPYSDLTLTRQIVTARINHFLANPVAIRLVFQDDGRPFAYPFGLVFLLGSGLVAMAFGSVVVYEIDRRQQTVTLKRQGLLGRSEQQYAWAEVQQLEIEVSEGLQGQSDCRICLMLRSGKQIPFTPHYLLNYQDAQKTVQQIEAFLLETL